MSRPPIKGLTERQKEALRWIMGFIEKSGMPPTVREVAGALNIKSSTAFYLLTQIEEKGCLRRGGMGARSLDVISSRAKAMLSEAERTLLPGLAFCRPRQDRNGLSAVPLIGVVAAGKPLVAEERLSGEVHVDERIAARGRCFALDISGDSMKDAGIYDGDVIIARQQPVAEHGDVVVALLNEDEATVKELSIRGDNIELRPRNPEHKPISIRPGDGLHILGKVIAVTPGDGPHVNRRN